MDDARQADAVSVLARIERIKECRWLPVVSPRQAEDPPGPAASVISIREAAAGAGSTTVSEPSTGKRVDPGVDAAARAERAALFRYVVADNASEYWAIMTLFASGFMLDLSAEDVAARLSEGGMRLSIDEAGDRCRQLRDWGNLDQSVRDARVKTVSDYLRSRDRYQVSQLGMEAHSAVAEIMALQTGASEVARELLEAMIDEVRHLSDELARPTPAPEVLARHTSALFSTHGTFDGSVRAFYSFLPQVLSRFDLAGEDYVKFKELLTSYVLLVNEDVSRHAPRLATLLSELGPHVPSIVDALTAEVEMINIDGTAARRLPGRTSADWAALGAYYADAGDSSSPQMLRDATSRALSQLLSNAKRMLAAASTNLSRHADLLRLAQMFDVATSPDAHRIFDAAFGLYPSRHLADGPEEPPAGVGATTSWWQDPGVDVAVSLRLNGDRAARGRTSAIPDPGLEVDALLAEAAVRANARAAAAHELAAAGAINATRISPAARDLLLEMLGAALAAQATDEVRLRRSFPDLGLHLSIEHTPGQHTVCTSTDGGLSVHDLRVEVTTDAGANATAALQVVS